MWNNSIKLVSKTEKETNENGFDAEKEIFIEGIPANLKDCTRDDGVLASQSGYTADLSIEIASCNYAGEKTLYNEATGEKYEIKRTFRKDKSMNITLTCERRD